MRGIDRLRISKYCFTIISVIILDLFSFSGYATTYYISSIGNDSNTGLTTSLPWKTLTKVNGFSFKPGDQVLFQRGDTFYGTLTINSSGVAGSPILYGTYGTGANPIITGFTSITGGWTDEGSGIYSKVITSQAQTNMVTIDDVQYGMGRYPNSTFLTYESASGYVSITDNQLTDTPNWTGAEAVIYKYGYRIERDIITNHTSNTLTYSILSGSNMNAPATGKYFIQNDLKTLDQFGEWYHNVATGKLYMYFGAIDPATKTVRVATLNNLCKVNTTKSYVTFDGLALTGSISTALLAQYNCHYLTIQNCNISFIGSDGVFIEGQNATINNSTCINCNRISIQAVGVNASITNNSISNNAVILGQGNFGYSGTSAIVVLNDNANVSGNNIQNTATNGIFLSSNVLSGIVKNNYIYNSCIWNWDHGGIYASGYRTALSIEGNIIDKSSGNGIFLDAVGGFSTVKNNSVSDCALSGIDNHQQNNNTFLGNTVYNCKYGLRLLNAININNMFNINSTGNVFVAKTSAQVALYYFTSYTGYISTLPTYSLSNNIYARPIDESKSIYFNALGIGGYKTLEDWKAFSGQDANSNKSPQSITSENDLQFEYNNTRTLKTVALAQPMIDMKGTKYLGSLTLQPFTSVVLMKDLGDVTAPVISDFSVPATSASLTVPVISLNATDNVGITGYLLTETSTKPTSTSSGWLASKPTSYTFSTEGTKSLYAWVKDGAGNVSAYKSNQVIITTSVSGNTVGYTEIYGLTSTSPNRRAMPVTINESGTIQSISIYHNGGTGNVLLGVYSDQSGTPFTQLGVTSSTGVSATAGWQTVSLTSPVSVNAGQTIWLAWVFQNNPGIRYVDTTPGRAHSTATWTEGMPATFGTSTIGASKYSIYCTFTKNNTNLGYTEIYGQTSTSPNRRAMPVTINESGTIQSISIYHNGGTGNFLLGVYSDQNGTPSTQLGVTSSTGVSATSGWQTVSLTSPVSVNAGQTVWLAWVFQNNPGIRYVDTTPGRAHSTATWTEGMPTSFGTSTIGASKYSIYCTYTKNSVNTLGYPEIYGLTSTSPNRRAMPVTFSETGTIKSISIYHNGGTGNVLLGVYSDLNGSPLNQLGVTLSSGVSATAGWQTVSLTNPVAVSAGQTVWLAWVFQNNPGIRYVDTTPGRAHSTATWIDGMPASFGTSTIAASKYSIYCTYTTSNIKNATIQKVSESELFSPISNDLNNQTINNLATTNYIDFEKEYDFKLYPNPSKTIINVDFVNIPFQGTSIEILNVNGEKVFETFQVSSSNEINISLFPSGIYIVRTFQNKHKTIKKLIIQ